jgi:hypothetical protein
MVCRKHGWSVEACVLSFRKLAGFRQGNFPWKIKLVNNRLIDNCLLKICNSINENKIVFIY